MNELINETEANEITERDNLAIVARISELATIQGKDFVELCKLEGVGFTCVVEKHLHKVGDLVVFIKYDTVVPENELFEFMRPFKFRVKPKSFTLKDGDEVVGRIYSQGIVLPEGVVVKSLQVHYPYILGFEEGCDLTNYLEVLKYIPPIMKGSGTSFGEMRTKGSFPTHIVSKTDENNLATRVRLLEELKGKPAYISLKIEGSSLTTFLDDATGELVVCSRNNMLAEAETNKFWLAANKYNLKEKLVDYPWLIIQGELAGPGIQKNKLGLTGPDLFVFNMVDKRNRQRLNYNEFIEMLLRLSLQAAPILSTFNKLECNFDELQVFADQQKYDNGELAEGIVIRPQVPFFSTILKEDWSCKVINREYKL